ncbi:MAG: type II toxin-antitoxin system HigB family toxin [Planctomycetota bacterium]|nr:type II toxin-antitoxin system HigB family toxin [Planctomycetota bacterium]
MNLFGQDVLDEALWRHSEVRTWIGRWIEIVDGATWRSIHEVRTDYPSADGVKLASNRVLTIFNVKGNEFRLLTHIDYSEQFVGVLELMTHAEYGKSRWKQRY